MRSFSKASLAIAVSGVAWLGCSNGPRPIDVSKSTRVLRPTWCHYLDNELDPCTGIGWLLQPVVQLRRQRFVGRVSDCLYNDIPYPIRMVVEGTVHGRLLQYRLDLPADGRFEIPNLAKGKWSGAACAMGWEVDRFEITIASGESDAPINLRLSTAEAQYCSAIGNR